MNALETIIHLKFRKYSNFLRILNLSHLSTSQTPRTFSIHVTPLLNPLPRGEDLPSPQGLKSGVSHKRNKVSYLQKLFSPRSYNLIPSGMKAE